MPIDDGAIDFLRAFSDPQMVAKYTDGTRRFIPGLEDLHRMTGILLNERAPQNAKILVLGAGGGMELKALADNHPGWHFVGVDPSLEMLRLAERTLGAQAARVDFVEGYIEDAPPGPFDAAVCLLTLHFLDPEARRTTVNGIWSRLKPGAPFAVAHSSFPQSEAERPLWLERYASFAVTSGVDPDQAKAMQAAVGRSLTLLTPQEDEDILRAAGFAEVTLFYAAFTWRGWIAHA
jgi:tRNA (cmo5U34)-methyltransferase